MKSQLFLCMFAGMTLAVSCDRQDVTGSWVEPIPGMEDCVQGFTLNEGGSASSVNMATLVYESWERKGDTLLLSGKSIGNHQTLPFTDTLVIKKLTSDKMVVTKYNIELEYSRYEE